MNAVQRHRDAIRAGTVTKTNVIGMRKLINATEKAMTWGGSWRGKGDICGMDAIDQALEAEAPRVSGELHDSGLAVLRSRRYRKRLEAAGVAYIVDELDHFELVRFDRIGRDGVNSVPVYRAVDVRGHSFLFRNISWQSGGNGPEIMEDAA